MPKVKDVRWGRWVGAIAGVLVLFKSVVFVVARLLGLAKNEAQARGSDTAFVLGLAERRRAGRV
jgi:hypothetical protein